MPAQEKQFREQLRPGMPLGLLGMMICPRQPSHTSHGFQTVWKKAARYVVLGEADLKISVDLKCILPITAVNMFLAVNCLC